MSGALARAISVLAPALLLAPFAGCVSSPPGLYRWGSYEDSVAQSCREPGGEHVPDQIRKLSGEIEKARVEGARVGPGVHAHLGWLYELTGNHESAALEFAAEKELYPESAVFVDGLLRRMRK